MHPTGLKVLYKISPDASKHIKSVDEKIINTVTDSENITKCKSVLQDGINKCNLKDFKIF